MKTLLAAVFAGMLVTTAVASEEKKAPETKKVCIDVQGKDGKPVMDPKTKKPKQKCTTVKVRQKHEGTKIEDAKKK